MTTKAKPKAKPKAAKAPKTNDKASPAPDPAHVAFMKSVLKESGPCEAVRATAKKYPSLRRSAVIAIAKACGVNPATASTQYQKARADQ